MNVENEDGLASLLELAANNDVEDFKRCLDRGSSSVDEVGLWYGRAKGSSKMVLQHRTPLMVAATYGSIDVLELILSSPQVDVNRLCGVDKTSALHCAASGGSENALDAVKLLLAAGGDPNLSDANGLYPVHVIIASPKFQSVKYSLQMLLAIESSFEEEENSMLLSQSTSDSNSPPLSPTDQGNGSPESVKLIPEKKEYPIDPTLPDIKNNVYSTDEFRMFAFKVRPCSRAYSHEWTECPFAHPGENAKRRDPRRYHYSCVPCPDFRKGACRRGDICEYAHGVFECWLHPAQYRTRLCKDGTSCSRRVCFFAHTPDELHPLYMSTNSAVLSPRSPSSVVSPFTPPRSPSQQNGSWPPQQSVPALHLPGSSNFQSSRLRSSLSARDIPPNDLSFFQDFDEQHAMSNINTGILNRSTRQKNLTPSNLDDIFNSDACSPRYGEQSLASAVYSPTHKSAVFNQFQQVLSPIKINPQRNVDQSLLQSPFSVTSPGRMSPRGMDPISPMSARLSILSPRENNNHHQVRSRISRDLGANAPAAIASVDENWSQWVSPTRAREWAFDADEFVDHKRSSSVDFPNGGDEPDLSWVHSLVKESPAEEEKFNPGMAEGAGIGSSSSEDKQNITYNQKVDPSNLGAWIEQMQLTG